jgi:hypothetical protein
MHYNFCRIHKTLWVNPAMEANLLSNASLRGNCNN